MPPSEAPLTELQCVIEKRPSGELRKRRISWTNHLRAKGKLLKRNLCSQPVAKMLNKHELKSFNGPGITLYCLQAHMQDFVGTFNDCSCMFMRPYCWDLQPSHLLRGPCPRNNCRLGSQSASAVSVQSFQAEALQWLKKYLTQLCFFHGNHSNWICGRLFIIRTRTQAQQRLRSAIHQTTGMLPSKEQTSAAKKLPLFSTRKVPTCVSLPRTSQNKPSHCPAKWPIKIMQNEQWD